jgi:transcriptional regulator CtsR
MGTVNHCHLTRVASRTNVEEKDSQTAERFLTVPTDISGVLNTSPTESQGICSHYVKRGLQTLALEERLPEDLSSSILQELLFKIKVSAVYVKPF